MTPPSAAKQVTAMESSRPQCEESCGSLECGIGPCGQLCGTCRLGSVCAAGVCVCSEDDRAEPVADNHCADLTARGRCDGEILRRCSAGQIEQLPCSSVGRVCGWDPTAMNGEGAHSCLLPDAPEFTCTPQCEQRICGDDGCGGLCGTCPDGMECLGDGSCAATVACDPEEKVGHCDGDLLTFCADGCPATVHCDQFGQQCGFDTEHQRFDCLPCDGRCERAEPTLAGDCDDGNECTTDKLVDGHCVFTPRPDDTRCAVDDLCVAEARCLSGQCVVKLETECDDGDPCTLDACEPSKGCVAVPTPDGPCDDGDPCTGGDACIDGTCVGGAPPAEICNGHDDDCNGQVDDACECVADVLHHSGPMVSYQPSGESAAVITSLPAHWTKAREAMPDSEWIGRPDGGAASAGTEHYATSFQIPEVATSMEGLLSVAADHTVVIRLNGGVVFDSSVAEPGEGGPVDAGFATYIELDDALTIGLNQVDFFVTHPSAVTANEPSGLIFELSTLYRFASVDGICIEP